MIPRKELENGTDPAQMGQLCKSDTRLEACCRGLVKRKCEPQVSSLSMLASEVIVGRTKAAGERPIGELIVRKGGRFKRSKSVDISTKSHDWDKVVQSHGVE